MAGAAAVLFAGTMAALIALPTTVFASTAPGLGTAKAYAVLAGTPSITNTGPSVISGSVGISPAASVIGLGGLPKGTVTNGTIQAGTAAAGIAKGDLTTAYLAAKSSPCNFNETGVNLGGKTLTPGTYCQTTAPTLTGILTLSGNGVFIFQAGSTLVTAPAAVVRLTNGAQPCNVFWQVSSSATLNTTTTFVGTIMALTDVHVRTGASIAGRALARNGTVTLDTNRITAPTGCNATTVNGPGVPIPSTGAASGSMPAGSVLVMIGSGLVVLTGGATVNRRRRARARR
ncbi:MAG: ice-binding family protein [Candidatus Dormibacter sp.]